MTDYIFQREQDEILIFVKYLGDNEISLEINQKTNEIKKFVNDFRKKVEVNLDDQDIDFLKSKNLTN